MGKKLSARFFQRDVLEVAPDLLGKILVRKFDSGNEHRFRITDVEAYRGEEDKACHASRGRTAHTELLYGEGGKIYVYLIYGMYWLLNFVTGDKDKPQGVIRYVQSKEYMVQEGSVGRLSWIVLFVEYLSKVRYCG